jgi:hypothetical protein
MNIRHIFTLLAIVAIASCTHEVINAPTDPTSPIDVGGGGTTPNNYNTNAYNPNKYWYNPGTGYPIPYSYGSGTVNPGPPDASANTGSSGAPYSIIQGRSGDGGSGLFMIRYKLY